MLSQSINRAFVNGSVSEHVVDFDLDSPEGVVVDWVAHNLYWVDSGTRRIEMSHIDGSSRRVIVWRNVQPRSLAVDPTHGLVCPFMNSLSWLRFQSFAAGAVQQLCQKHNNEVKLVDRFHTFI